MKDFSYNVLMLVTSILTGVFLALLVFMLMALASCHSDGPTQFLNVECVNDTVVITTEVPHLYEGTLEIDGVPYAHPITLPKEDFAPGPHVVTLTCVHVGPQPGPFHGYQAYGPVFTRTDVFEIEGETVVSPPDDGNNGHGDEDDHDDDSNPGRSPHGHKHHGGKDAD